MAGIAVQPDGKIVAVGRAAMGFTVVRLQVDGALDPSFGSGGIVDTLLGDPALRDEASAVVLLADGRILVAGTADYDYPYPSDFALVRYLSDGRLDRTFGLDGVVVTQDAGEEIANALALTPSGGIVVAGAADRAFSLARYRPTGALDPGFGTAGIVSTAVGTLYADARALAVQADGRVIAGGQTRQAGVGMFDELALVATTPTGRSTRRSAREASAVSTFSRDTISAGRSPFNPPPSWGARRIGWCRWAAAPTGMGGRARAGDRRRARAARAAASDASVPGPPRRPPAPRCRAVADSPRTLLGGSCPPGAAPRFRDIVIRQSRARAGGFLAAHASLSSSAAARAPVAKQPVAL